MGMDDERKPRESVLSTPFDDDNNDYKKIKLHEKN